MFNFRAIISKLNGYIKVYGKNPKDVFTSHWKNNHWNNSESKSGSGSTLKYTAYIRNELPRLLRRLHVKSMLDAPCGDFNWMKEVEFDSDVNYIGGDIVEDLIVGLNGRYQTDVKKFIVLDVVNDRMPMVDLWMCRDLIFHLPTVEIFKLIDNFLRSEVKYLLITSHADIAIINGNIFLGGFRLINLMNKPYFFPEPDERIKDYIDGFPERYLLLYKRQALQDWKNTYC